MSLALPVMTQFDNTVAFVQQRAYIQTAKNNLRVRYDCQQWTVLCVLLTDCDQLCRCGEARHMTKLRRDAVPIVCANAKV